MMILPFSGNPANVVAITSSLDVYPTSLCTMSLYSYVVYLRHFKNNYIEQKNADVEKICLNTSACAEVLLFLLPLNPPENCSCVACTNEGTIRAAYFFGNNSGPLTW